MGAHKDHVLYLTTGDGVYEATPNGGQYHTRRLGLPGKFMQARPIVDRADPRRMWVGTVRDGVFHSEDGGATWRAVNDGITYKEVWSMAQHPATGEVFVGTGPCAVYRTADGGETWTDCAGLRDLPSTKDWTFPRPPHIPHVKDFGFHAAAPGVILCPVEEGWLLRSADDGKTWENLTDEVEFDAHFIAVMPDDPDVVIMTSGVGLYRSTDGGRHFVEIKHGLDRPYIGQMAVHPARPKVLFTPATAVPPPDWRRPQGADSGVYRSEDQGLTWERLTGGLPEHITAGTRAIAGDPAVPEAVCVGFHDGSVWRTDDSGESFRQVVSGLPPINGVCVVPR